jgi:hypothetical protein
VKDNISRGNALNSYLSAYTEGIGNEEKINITKLYEDLKHLTKGEPYIPPYKLSRVQEQLEEPRTPQRYKEIDDSFTKKLLSA